MPKVFFLGGGRITDAIREGHDAIVCVQEDRPSSGILILNERLFGRFPEDALSGRFLPTKSFPTFREFRFERLTREGALTLLQIFFRSEPLEVSEGPAYDFDGDDSQTIITDVGMVL